MASLHKTKVNKKLKLEDEVARLCSHKGVKGVIVTTEKWTVLKSTFDEKMTDFYKQSVKGLEDMGVAFVRDSDPKNGLLFLRVESRKFEIMLSIGKDHRVILVHTTAKPEQQLLKQLQSVPLEFACTIEIPK